MGHLFAGGDDLQPTLYAYGYRPAVAISDGAVVVEVHQESLGPGPLTATVGGLRWDGLAFHDTAVTFADGEHPAVAAEGSLVVVVYESGEPDDEYSVFEGERFLWSMLGRVTTPPGEPPRLTPLSYDPLGTGRHPSVALRRSPRGGHLLVCMVDRPTGALTYTVGTVAPGAVRIAWGRPRPYLTGYRPSVTVPATIRDPETDVIAAHQAEPTVSDLAVAHGRIDLDRMRVVWDAPVTYTRGFAPCVAASMAWVPRDAFVVTAREVHQADELSVSRLWHSQDDFAWRAGWHGAFVESDVGGHARHDYDVNGWCAVYESGPWSDPAANELNCIGRT